MAQHARDLGLERVAIVRDITNDYSIGLASAFEEEFLKSLGAIAGHHSYRGGAVDPVAAEQWLEWTLCDGVFLPGYVSDVTTFINATRPVWSERSITILGGDGWEALVARSRRESICARNRPTSTPRS